MSELTPRQRYNIAYRSERLFHHEGYSGNYWLETGTIGPDRYTRAALDSYAMAHTTYNADLIDDRQRWRKLAKTRRYAHPEQTLKHIAEKQIREHYRLATWNRMARVLRNKLIVPMWEYDKTGQPFRTKNER